jgi:hypothetical protein
MTFALRLGRVETIPQQDSAERAFNKLARTFAAQVEALKRYRSRGDQTVRVEHVTVNEGGQAIVGNVNHGGRGSLKNQEANVQARALHERGPERAAPPSQASSTIAQGALHRSRPLGLKELTPVSWVRLPLPYR